MAQEEKWHIRDLTYSIWHRIRSIGRYVGIEKAQTLAMVDVDVPIWIEYGDEDKACLALIETARDTGQQWKSGAVLMDLARKSRLPAFVVLYALSENKNPVDGAFQDIDKFRVRRLFPYSRRGWVEMSPQEYADFLLNIRRKECEKIDREFGYGVFDEVAIK